MIRPSVSACSQREFFIDNLLVRIHFIIVMIRWTGLAPWEFEFPFTGSLTFTLLKYSDKDCCRAKRGELKSFKDLYLKAKARIWF